MGEAAVSGAGHAAHAVGSEAIDVVIEYLVPIGAGIAGLTVGTHIFGGQSIAGQLSESLSGANISGASFTRLTGALLAGIFAIAGYAFWRLGKRDGWVMKLLGKAFGGFFLGTAAGYAVGPLLLNKPVNGGGLIDKLVNGFSNIAGGG